MYSRQDKRNPLDVALNKGTFRRGNSLKLFCQEAILKRKHSLLSDTLLREVTLSKLFYLGSTLKRKRIRSQDWMGLGR